MSRRKPVTIEFPYGKIMLKGAEIVTEGLRDDPEASDEYKTAMDAVESLILAQYMEGIDVSTKAYKRALGTCLEACADNIL